MSRDELLIGEVTVERIGAHDFYREPSTRRTA